MSTDREIQTLMAPLRLSHDYFKNIIADFYPTNERLETGLANLSLKLRAYEQSLCTNDKPLQDLLKSEHTQCTRSLHLVLSMLQINAPATSGGALSSNQTISPAKTEPLMEKTSDK